MAEKAKTVIEEEKQFTRTEKIQKLILQVSQLIIICSASILLFLFVLGFVNWLNDIKNLNILGVIIVFFLLPFLVCTYAVRLIQEKLEEYRPKLKLGREELKQLAYASIPTIGMFIAGSLINYYFNLFPKTLSDNVSLEIFKVMIQINGFLIGFVGIVFAQLLWAIHNQQSNTQKNILDSPFIKSDKHVFDIREDYLTAYEKKRASMILIMFIVVTFFIVSILFSLSGLAQTDLTEPIKTDPQVTIPFWVMTYGIFVFVFSIAQSKMDVRDEVSKLLDKRIMNLKKEIVTKNKEISTKNNEIEVITEENSRLAKEIQRMEKEIRDKSATGS